MYGVRESKLPKNLRDKESGEFIWYMKQGWGVEPRSAYEGDCLGFKVASSVRDDDEGDLGETCPLKDIAKTHAAFFKVAKKKWDAFAKWLLKNHGVKLPKAALWLTTDERA
jgi:hypothetical protein